MFYGSFCKCAKRQKRETKKLGKFLKFHILGILKLLLLKFSMWTIDGGGHFHSKNCLVS